MSSLLFIIEPRYQETLLEVLIPSSILELSVKAVTTGILHLKWNIVFRF